MTTEVSTLGLKVDSSDVPRAAAELDKLAAAGSKSEKAVDGLADHFKALNATMGGVASNTAEMARQMASLNAANTQNAATLGQVVARLDQMVSGQNAAVAAMLQGNTAAAGMAAAMEGIRAETAEVAVGTKQMGAVVASALREGNLAAAGMASALEEVRAESASAAAGMQQLARASDDQAMKASAAQLAAVNTQIKQTAAASPAAVAGIGQANAAVKSLGISAAQTTAAMRMLPMQMTDVVTQLAGGQNPLLILVQQGGQIKDSFGGIKPTIQALSGLITPLSVGLTLSGAAVAGLAVAYYKGAQEADEFNKQLILQGRVAGVTKAQLMDMAREVSQGIGTQGKAADVLAQLVATGQVAGDQMKAVGTSIVAMSDATGRGVGEMVKEFADLGKAPVEASKKLNEQYHYLTLAVYSQIKALQDQGREEEASALAQRSLAAAMTSRAQEIVKDLGYVERAWKLVGKVAKESWDFMLGVGREATLADKISELEERVSRNKTIQRLDRESSDPLLYAPTRYKVKNELEEDEAQLARLRLSKRLAEQVAEKEGAIQRTKDAGISAATEIDSRRKAMLKGEEKIQSELADMQKRYAAIRAADPKDPRLDPKAIAADEAAIREANKTRGGDTRRTAASTMSAELARIQAQAKTTAQALADADQMMQAVRAAGGLADDEYFSKKQDNLRKTADLQVQALKDENAALNAQKATDAQKIENDGKVLVNLERIKQVTAEALQAERILELQRVEAARARSAAYRQAQNDASDYLDSMQKALKRESAAVGMSEEAKRQTTGRYQIDDRYDLQVRAANRAREELQRADSEFPLGDGAKRWNADTQQAYNERIRLATETRDKEVAIWEDGYGKIKAAEMDWNAGAAKAFEDYANSAAKASTTAGSFVSGALRQGEDALVKFAKTGKLSFSDLFNFMADEFIRQQARMMVASATSSSGGGSGLLGVLGSLASAYFGGNTGAAAGLASSMSGDSLDNMLALTNNFANRAIGGPVSAGGTYNINERGEPEVLSYGNKQILMMGKQAGTVSPLRSSLDAAAGAKSSEGQGAVNVTLNMKFGSDVSVPTLAAWGHQIRESLKGEILYSQRVKGAFSQ